MPIPVSQDPLSIFQPPVPTDHAEPDTRRRDEPSAVPSESSQPGARRESDTIRTIPSECGTYDEQPTNLLDAIVTQCRTGSISKAVATRKILDRLDEQHTISPQAREQAFASYLSEINSITSTYAADPIGTNSRNPIVAPTSKTDEHFDRRISSAIQEDPSINRLLRGLLKRPAASDELGDNDPSVGTKRA